MKRNKSAFASMLRNCLVVAPLIIGLGACTADDVEVKISASDIARAMSGDSVNVPFHATFSTIGTLTDEQRAQLSSMKILLKQYVDISTFDTDQDSTKTVISVDGTLPLAVGGNGAANAAWLINVSKVVDPALSQIFPYSVELSTGSGFSDFEDRAKEIDFLSAPEAVQPIKFRVSADAGSDMRLLAGGFEQDGTGNMVSVVTVPQGETASLVFQDGAYGLVGGGFLITTPPGAGAANTSTIGAIAKPAASSWDGTWEKSQTAGSDILLPSFLFYGPMRSLVDKNDNPYGTAFDGNSVNSLSVRQYEVADWPGNPYSYLVAEAHIGSPTFHMDRPAVGIISGLQSLSDNYYGICRQNDKTLYCVDMFWKTYDDPEITPMVAKIEASFPKTEVLGQTQP